MQALTREQTLAIWQEAERAARARLGEPGTLSLKEVGKLSAHDFFERIGNGDLPCPPFGHLVDFIPLEWEPGRFLFQGTPDTRHYNPLGSVHGGYAATLLDSCMGCAVHTCLQPGQGYTTMDLRVSYVRAITADTGPLRAEGKVVHVGRSTALAEGRLYDVDDRLYAVGSTTCMVLELRR
ncbi:MULTISPECIES: PaaI family thioesterase [unclassified Pseudomonas]|uniref:PaaI family thioesterase n=1 Tax=unclassified Pseudomonas TaxID=196821 RepID=UPI00244B715D|nr:MULTISPECIES: PaaI family thioesterase [unclassified Pseudomonas]MDG9931139.1 PaaI family thioesterase [Pseudomonas sp. GD04042]MDH0485610.1 PaaI family thioesterase [Pseudomonas sp. GD04015]MDH0605656.1 PaaI family thioesterase [Pseudomonas sp. GD03869]